MHVQWNLSNPTHQGTREMCQIVQDVGKLRVFLVNSRKTQVSDCTGSAVHNSPLFLAPTSPSPMAANFIQVNLILLFCRLLLFWVIIILDT